MNLLRSSITLCRARIALFAACSAVTGCLLAEPAVPGALAPLASGTFLLACGASALNQYQERDIDALMARTRHRPLPAGALSPRRAILTAVLLLSAGAACLAANGLAVLLLGLSAVLWYNGIYTPLKRVTAFASLYGVLVGAIPPAMGWIAGGGRLSDPRLLVMALLFMVWQVPHFWLLLLRHDAEYRGAGLPSITLLLPPERLAGITILWSAAGATLSLLLPLFGLVRSPVMLALLALLSLTTLTAALSRFRHRAFPDLSLRWSTAFLAAAMLLLSLDSILTGTF
jgi:protoheme IX farnesyltransferase